MTTTDTPAATPPASPAHDVGLLLALDTPYAPALTLGQDLPKTRGGLPCHHLWKESLVPGRLTDARGNEWNITPKDIDDAVSDLKRALSLGHEPTIRDDHFKPTKSFGFVIDARKNARGGLDLLHQFMGDAERDEAMRRKTSIMLRPNYTDGKRNSFKWYTDHSAVVFNPQLPGLSDYQPALAASNGDVVDAVVLTLADEATHASQTQGDSMPDLSKIRTALGSAAKDQSEEQVIALAALAITARSDTYAKLRTTLGDGANDKDDAAVLALAADQIEANTALDQELTRVEGELAAEKQRVLTLSADQPERVDDLTLGMRADAADEARDLVLSAGLTPAAAKIFDELFDGPDGEPSALALSAVSVGKRKRTLEGEFWRRMKQLIDLGEDAVLKTGDGAGRKARPVGTPAAPLALGAGDGEKTAKDVTPERQKELMEKGGFAPA